MYQCSPEHVVGVSTLVQQVDPGAHIVRILAVGDKLQVEAAAAVNSDAVGVLKLDRMGKSDHEVRNNGQIRAKANLESTPIIERDKGSIRGLGAS